MLGLYYKRAFSFYLMAKFVFIMGEEEVFQILLLQSQVHWEYTQL